MSRQVIQWTGDVPAMVKFFHAIWADQNLKIVLDVSGDIGLERKKKLDMFLDRLNPDYRESWMTVTPGRGRSSVERHIEYSETGLPVPMVDDELWKQDFEYLCWVCKGEHPGKMWLSEDPIWDCVAPCTSRSTAEFQERREVSDMENETYEKHSLENVCGQCHPCQRFVEAYLVAEGLNEEENEQPRSLQDQMKKKRTGMDSDNTVPSFKKKRSPCS